MAPLATIIVPTYNRATTLARTLASLAPQREHGRIVVLDDASTDDTAEVCRPYGDLIDYRRNPQRLGLFGNWNQGVRVAETPYVAIYHDDDLYEPHIVERSVSALEERPNATFVHTGCLYIDDEDRVVGEHRAAWPPVTEGEAFRRTLAGRFSSPVAAPSAMLRREAVLAVGGFDERLRVSSDLTMWMALARLGDVAYLAEPLMRFRRRGRYANDHAAVNWDILGEHVEVASRTELEVHGRLRLGFRVRRTLYLLQFLGRDALEPAAGDRGRVLAVHGSPALRGAARIVGSDVPIEPLLRGARHLVRWGAKARIGPRGA